MVVIIIIIILAILNYIEPKFALPGSLNKLKNDSVCIVNTIGVLVHSLCLSVTLLAVLLMKA